MTVADVLLSAFQILIGPAALGFLVWCYFKVQNDPGLKAPAKMSLDVLESDKAPKDWAHLDSFPDTESDGEDGDSDDKKATGEEDGESSDDEGGHGHTHSHGDDHGHSHEGGHNHSHQKPAGGHTHSHNGVPCHGHGGPPPGADDGDLKIKLGVGPQGVKGRPNQGRPDPRTMKLMLLESLRDKKNKLEERKEEMDPEQYKTQMENLVKAEENAKKMPTDPKIIEENMKQKAIRNARATAKQQLDAIAEARASLLRARAENRVPDNVFEMNIKRMKAGHDQFTKMMKATDTELLEIMKQMQQKAMQMQRMQQMEMAKRKAQMEKAKAAAAQKDTPRITEIEEDAEEIDMDKHEASPKSTRLRRNVNKAE
jgi:hypothetical protein